MPDLERMVLLFSTIHHKFCKLGVPLHQAISFKETPANSLAKLRIGLIKPVPIA